MIKKIANTRVLEKRGPITDYFIFSLLKLRSMPQIEKQRKNLLLTCNQKSDDGQLKQAN